jgi:hypothetical protein
LSSAERDRFFNPRYDPLWNVQRIPVRKPQYAKSPLDEEGISICIVPLLPVGFVVVAIQLDDKPRTKPHKVNDIGSDGRLAPKPYALRL